MTEIGRVVGLLKEIDKFKGTSAVSDVINWNIAAMGDTLSIEYTKLKLLGQPGGSTGPWLKVWKSLVPSKIKCFTWLVARRACLTHEVLQKKGFQLVCRNFLCNDMAETNNHLFLHCKVTA